MVYSGHFYIIYLLFIYSFIYYFRLQARLSPLSPFTRRLFFTLPVWRLVLPGPAGGAYSVSGLFAGFKGWPYGKGKREEKAREN